MKRNIYTIIVLTVFISVVSGCSSKQSEITTTTLDYDKGKDTMENKTNIKVDDLMETVDWIGKTFEEIDISLSDNTSYANIDGYFFGCKASGDLSLNNDKAIRRISFTVKNSSINDLYDRLTELYYGPVQEGMEPYAEVNGGAVEWYTFDTGKVFINIRQGSINSYVSVEITENPEPHEVCELTLRKYAESEISTLPLNMNMEVTGYENGILTVAIKNQVGEPMTYTNDYVLAKSYDGGQTYAHLSKMGQEMSDREIETYEIDDLETQEIKCDLRNYGLPEAGLYMLILDDMTTEFELIPKDDDKGEVAEASWFCANCGKKNRGTEKCIDCGEPKQ